MDTWSSSLSTIRQEPTPSFFKLLLLPFLHQLKSSISYRCECDVSVGGHGFLVRHKAKSLSVLNKRTSTSARTNDEVMRGADEGHCLGTILSDILTSVRLQPVYRLRAPLVCPSSAAQTQTAAPPPAAPPPP